MTSEQRTTQDDRILVNNRLKGPRHEIKRGEEGFPDALMHIDSPPEKLYVIGDIDCLNDGLAVVGARKATPYGLLAAKKFTTRAAQKGITIISGGALGCDSAAHRAALESKGKTVAILGGGCDVIYPAQNCSLFQQIIDGGGAILSEHAWDFPPLPHTFRMRNRLIAGLARATLIVEAGIPSGTFSTADDALSSNRDVLVVPGSITSPNSRGTNRLLYQGAIPIVDEESFEDALFNIFGFLKNPSVQKTKDTINDPILRALYANPMRIDELLTLVDTNESATDKIQYLTVHLAELQHTGKIAAYPDGTFGPAEKAFR